MLNNKQAYAQNIQLVPHPCTVFSSPPPRLLMEAAQEGPLVLVVQQAEFSEGTREGLPLLAPATFEGQGARVMPRLAGHFEKVCLAV